MAPAPWFGALRVVSPLVACRESRVQKSLQAKNNFSCVSLEHSGSSCVGNPAQRGPNFVKFPRMECHQQHRCAEHPAARSPKPLGPSLWGLGHGKAPPRERGLSWFAHRGLAKVRSGRPATQLQAEPLVAVSESRRKDAEKSPAETGLSWSIYHGVCQGGGKPMTQHRAAPLVAVSACRPSAGMFRRRHRLITLWDRQTCALRTDVFHLA